MFILTFSALQTKTDTCANSVDPDEMAHNEPSHQGLHYLLFCFWLLTETQKMKESISENQEWNG